MGRWKPNKTAAKEFANTMREIDSYCRDNGIKTSASGDSYYFSVNGIDYRVSNHTVESSNYHAQDELTGEIKREKYHEDGRNQDTVYIHASKTRIIEIHKAIIAGKKLDGRGREVTQ